MCYFEKGISSLRKLFNVYRAAYSGLPKASWLLAIVMLVNRSGSVVLFFITLYLTTKLNYSVQEAGQLVSLYGVGSMAGAFLGGWLSDRWGIIKVQVTSLVGSAIGVIWLSYLETALEIGIMLLVLSAVTESLRPANSAAVALLTPPEKRARAFGLNRLAVNFGVAIGPAIGGFLATIDYSYLFWMDGITCLLAAALLWYFFPTEPVSASPKTEVDTKSSIKALSPWKNKTYLILLGLIFCSSVVFNQLFNTWPLYLREVNLYPENIIGILMALNAIIIVLIEMPALHRLESMDPLRLMIVGTLLMGGFALTPLSAAVPYVAFTVVIWTMGEIFLFPITATYISNMATDQNRGAYMGMFTLVFAFGFVLGPLLGMGMYEHFGPNSVWIGCGILALFSASGLFLLKRKLKRDEVKTAESVKM